jgi:hypothetical protein
MKTLIAAVALALSLITIPAFIQAAEGLTDPAMSSRPLSQTADRSWLAQYCIPQGDESVTLQKIYCRSPGRLTGTSEISRVARGRGGNPELSLSPASP